METPGEPGSEHGDRLGQTLMVTRAILRDETKYPDPDTFNPARFLTPDGKLNRDVPDPVQVFGYGRRICPGRYFAEDILFLGMSSILAVFSIEKPVDELGNAITPQAEFSSGLFRSVRGHLVRSVQHCLA
jgi:cytochrome P450